MPKSSNVTHAGSQDTINRTGASLFLPKTYEQYLSLNNPSDVAFSHSHIAIADNDILYVYDRATQTYSKTSVTEQRIISKIGYTAGGRLFVAVSGISNQFYEYNATENRLTLISSINCSTFCIDNDSLYTATIDATSTHIGRYSINSIGNSEVQSHNLGTIDTNKTPSMTCLNGRLYCTIEDHVYHIDPDDEAFSDTTLPTYLSLNMSDAKNVRSTCAHNNAFYYTAEGGLYRAELSTTDDSAKKATCVLQGKNFGTLTSYDGNLYCIREKSVLRFDAEQTNYKIADYEISSSSSSVGRLSGATDVVRAGSLVVIAETANHRVTVYNGETEKYSVLVPEDEAFSPTLVATDGTLVAAVSGNKVYVCNNPKKSAKFEEPITITSTIKGIACVYGKIYYVTQNDIQGELYGEPSTKSNGTPFAMASDLYGNLYVAYTNGSVRSFTEEEFVTQDMQGTQLEDVTVPTGATSLRADFEGNLYYLKEGAMYRSVSEDPFPKINVSDFIYSESDKTPVAFALGYEDDEVYFLYDSGDFIIKTNAGTLGFPTLKAISADGVSVSQVQAKEAVELVDVKAKAVGMRVELSDFSDGAEYFPYSSYARTEKVERAVLLDETADGRYKLVALYEDKRYTVELFRVEDILPDELQPVWTGESGKRYFSSEAYAYNYPCITAARTADPLPRGTEVTLIDVMHAGSGAEEECGPDFAYIEYETAARARVRGYAPLSFLTEADPNGAAENMFTLGSLKEDVQFAAADGSSHTVKAGETVRLYDNGDGTYTARVTADGVDYEAQVEGSLVARGESDALRIALIVILSVLAAVIIGAYFFLLAGKKRKTKI